MPEKKKSSESESSLSSCVLTWTRGIRETGVVVVGAESFWCVIALGFNVICGVIIDSACLSNVAGVVSSVWGMCNCLAILGLRIVCGMTC